MYANIVKETSFWSRLVEIDEQLQQQLIAKGCPKCGGPLHVADYPRKPRGLPADVEQYFSTRKSTCCGHCRKRCTPSSVRFLGRRVYVAVIVILATMHALICSAAIRTLHRWAEWWSELLPATVFWRGLQGRFATAVNQSALPASLLERYEPKAGEQTQQGLIQMLCALGPITTRTVPVGYVEGGCGSASVTHKMRFDCNYRDPLRRARAPAKPT